MTVAPVELSPAALSLHARAQRSAAALFATLSSLTEEVVCSASESLQDRAGYVLIDDGFLKLVVFDRVIRHYQQGDLLCLPLTLPEARLTSEFATRGRFIARTAVLGSDNEAARAELIALLEAESQLLAAICGEHAEKDEVPRLRVRHAGVGEVLVREGEHTSEVYVMLEGRADAFVGGVAVGAIRPTEFIGEVSLLTHTVCSATVVTSEPCMLQVLQKNDLADVMRVRPALLLDLATTLAERLVRTNHLARTSLVAKPMPPRPREP